MTNTYSAKEWGNRIASFGRLVDIRNFPDVAAEVLQGKRPAYLGRGSKLETKHLEPAVIPAVVFWTKGPPEVLIENRNLRKTLELYQHNESVVGLQLSVTGFGGTFVEPGIGKPHKIAKGLAKVFSSGLIDKDAVTIRYDPLLKLIVDERTFLTNASSHSFLHVIQLFAELGIQNVMTKFLLSGSYEKSRYRHVANRMERFKIKPVAFSPNEIECVYQELNQTAQKLGVTLSTCCLKTEQKLKNWEFDQACLSADRLTQVGKRLFGRSWSSISDQKRESRTGCHCSAYWDLSNVKGHKKCGGEDAACIYCSASQGYFGSRLDERIEKEKADFVNGIDKNRYNHLLNHDKCSYQTTTY